MYDKNVEYHLVTSHDVYNTFIYTDSTYASDGVAIHDCVAPQTSTDSALETTASYNHFFVKHYYYSDYNQLFKIKTNYSKQNNFVLQESSRLFAIPNKSYGSKILENSITIVDNSSTSLTITDDGNGNLIDTSIATTNFVSSDNLLMWFSFNDLYVYKRFPNKPIIYLRDNTKYLNKIYLVNGQCSTGMSGSGYKYDLSGVSYACAQLPSQLNLNSAFTIAARIKIPTSQSVIGSDKNTIFSTYVSYESQYPIQLQIYNQTSSNKGKLLLSRSGVKDSSPLKPITLTSSTAINDNNYHHIGIVNSTGSIALYIDGILNATTSDYTGYYNTLNSFNTLCLGATATSPTSINTSSYFSGSFDDFRIYSEAVNVANLNSYPIDTNIIGSVFYEHGMIVLNNLSGSYSNLLKGSGATGFSATYKSVSPITEHEILVKKGVNEFNTTMNPSLRQNGTLVLQSNLTSSFTSSFSPYITGIGLYNDKNELMAMAKIRTPIKSLNDTDILFKIKFDI